MLATVIAAVSTPPGKGGVAVIRVSGEGTFDIIERVFLPRSGKGIYDYPTRHQIYGDVVFEGERLDDGMLTLFKSPASYTGEDTAELSIHGGTLITRRVLEALFALGARPAEAGEFTRRAFINGKLSLTEAEAIGILLEARSDEQIRLASSTARARLNEKIADVRREVTDLLSSMYARIDYPDEDLGDFTNEESIERLKKIKSALESLMSTYRTGKAINEGVDTVICGKPNVGKSTLYNLIFGEERAIVTDVEGTTRDILSGQIPLGRVLLNVYDTAGIRSYDEAERVEQIGIERARKRARECELLLCVFDSSRALNADDEEILALASESRAERVAIINKCDLDSHFDESRLDKIFDTVLHVSARDNENETVKALTETVERLFTDEKISASDDAIVATARQNARLLSAHSLISSALLAFECGVTQDAASSDVELALGEIGELDGRGVSEQVVADIFSKFCVGK